MMLIKYHYTNKTADDLAKSVHKKAWFVAMLKECYQVSSKLLN